MNLLRVGCLARCGHSRFGLKRGESREGQFSTQPFHRTPVLTSRFPVSVAVVVGVMLTSNIFICMTKPFGHNSNVNFVPKVHGRKPMPEAMWRHVVLELCCFDNLRV